MTHSLFTDDFYMSNLRTTTNERGGVRFVLSVAQYRRLWPDGTANSLVNVS